MLGIYLAALGFGSSLIVVSLFFGGGDKDFDKDLDLDKDFDLDAEAEVDAELDAEADLHVDVDADADADVDADADADADGHVEVDKSIDMHDAASGSEAFWLPFLSMRFWTFGMASFGLAGTLLSLFSVPWVLGLAVALLSGVALGWSAAWFFKALKKDEISGSTALTGYVGEEARVLLPIRPGQQGKVVVETLAGRVEMLATSRDGHEIERGSTVIIAQVREGVADVSQLSQHPPRPGGSQQRASQAQQRAGQTRTDV